MHEGALSLVLRAQQHPLLVHCRDEVTTVVWNQRVHLDGGQRQRGVDRRTKLCDSLPRTRRGEMGARSQSTQHQSLIFREQIGFVEDDNLRDVPRADVTHHVTHSLQLRRRVGMGSIDNVHDDIRIADLFQGRPESLHELMWQIAHEAHSVGQRVRASVRRFGPPHRGIQRREQRVLDEDARAGQCIQQAGLAGVRVSRDSDGRHGIAIALGTLRRARRTEITDLPTQLRHTGTDATTIQLDLRLTGTTGSHTGSPSTDLATGLTAHRLTPAAQAGKQVLQLRKFDLRLALTALCVLAENVEDDGRAVDDLHFDDVFERTALTRRELSIDDNRVSVLGLDDVTQFFCLPSPKVGRGVGVRTSLEHAIKHNRAGCLGERGKLTQRVLRFFLRTLRVHTNKHDVLQPELAILDLADVLEFGRQTGDTAQRMAILKVPLVAIRSTVTGGSDVLQSLRGIEHLWLRARAGSLDHAIEVVIGGAVAGRRSHLRLNLSRALRYARRMGSDHYFTADPASAENLRPLRVRLAGRDLELTTANGVFSPDRLDAGTTVLLNNMPPLPPGGDFLDLGSGWGPISLTMALSSPHARIWAVDVNERALDLVRRNAEKLGLDNVTAVRPEDVPDDVVFRTIRSNPPIRVGKNELHSMLERWIPRLDERSDAWLVVQRNLGADSLQRWMAATFPDGYSVHRAATGKGYRVLKVRHHGSPRTEAIALG